MRKQIDPLIILTDIFDVPMEHIVAMKQAQNIEIAKRLLDEAKLIAKKNWHKKAFKLHPDRGGDEDKLKELNSFYDYVKDIEVVIQRPRPQPIMNVRIVWIW